jgi:membrane-associated protease RseP (regulator of RpoE activity)
VAESSPAAAAGLRDGDVIKSVDDVVVVEPADLRNYVRSQSAGDTVTVVWTSDGVEKSADITLAAVDSGSAPGSDDSTRPGFLGVGTDNYAREQLSVPSALGRVGGDLADSVWATFEGIGTVANPWNQWDQLTNEDADPTKRPTTVVGITMVAGDIGESFGFYAVMEILASVNVFVGIFNLLPLLPFDGGHAAIATYERVRSRRGRQYRADVEKMWPLTVAVVTLLLFLTFTGLYLDITRPF